MIRGISGAEPCQARSIVLPSPAKLCWEGTGLLSIFSPVGNCFAPAQAKAPALVLDHSMPDGFSYRGKARKCEESFSMMG